MSRIVDRIRDISNSGALVVTNNIPTVQFKDAVKGRIPKVKNTPFFEFEVPDGGFVTVVDVSSPNAHSNPKISEALSIWETQTEQNLRRLPKFSSTPEGSIRSLDFPDRTVVIMKTEKSINDGSPKVVSGIRVVMARGHGEHLPFQKDFPEYNRVENAAEPGRLTGAGSTQLMLNFALRVIDQAPEITEVNVHTSMAHNTLYRRAGAKAQDERIYKKDDHNWILPFGRLEIKGVIKKTQKALEVSAEGKS